MKPDENKRGVQRGVNNRIVGSAPNLGPVPQLSRIGRVRHGVRRQRGGQSGQRTGQSGQSGQRTGHSRVRKRRLRSRVIAAWSAAFGLVTVGTLGLAFFLWLRPMLLRDKDTTEKDRVAEDRRVRKVSKFEPPGDRVSLALVKQALAVRDPDKVAALIRPGTLTHAEVVERLEAIETKDGEVAAVVWMSSVDRNGLSLEGVEVRCAKGDQITRRLALLTPDQEGVWKLDFASYARLVEPSWEKILAGEAPTAVVRVTLARDRYYNGPFVDEAKWVVYGMVSADMNELLLGYCKRDSPQHRALEMMWATDETKIRATLELQRTEGAEPRQFEISRVLAEDWVVGDLPFEEAVAAEK